MGTSHIWVQCAAADLCGALPSVDSLDAASSLCPSALRLLRSTTVEHNHAGLQVVLRVLRAFGDIMVRTRRHDAERALGGRRGGDLVLEERVTRCNVCAEAVLDAKPIVMKMVRKGGLLGIRARELKSAIEQFEEQDAM